MPQPDTGSDQLLATNVGVGNSAPAHITRKYCIEFFARPTGENSRGDHSPSLSPLPPSCLSLANTALTSISPDFLSVSAAAATSASLRAVVSAAGSSVAPVSTGAGFSLLARDTSRSRSICEARPSVTGSIGARFAEFQWVRSRIEAIVDLVVPTRRMMALSLSSGWLRTSHRMAFGRYWRRETGV